MQFFKKLKKVYFQPTGLQTKGAAEPDNQKYKTLWKNKTRLWNK